MLSILCLPVFALNTVPDEPSYVSEGVYPGFDTSASTLATRETSHLQFVAPTKESGSDTAFAVADKQTTTETFPWYGQLLPGYVEEKITSTRAIICACKQ